MKLKFLKAMINDNDKLLRTQQIDMT